MASRHREPTALFKALANRTRLRMIEILAQRPELRVGEIVEILGVPQPSASRHLAHLRRVQLVTMRAQGRTKWYSVAPASSTFIRGVLATLAKTPDLRLPSVRPHRPVRRRNQSSVRR